MVQILVVTISWLGLTAFYTFIVWEMFKKKDDMFKPYLLIMITMWLGVSFVEAMIIKTIYQLSF